MSKVSRTFLSLGIAFFVGFVVNAAPAFSGEAKFGRIDDLQKPASIRVVYPNGRTQDLELKELTAQFVEDSFEGISGQIFISPIFSDEHSIVTRKLWQSELAVEAIIEMMAKGPVTLRLNTPWKTRRSPFLKAAWTYYGLAGVTVQLRSRPPKVLSDVMMAYKQRQELELGRYVGFTANVRKVAKILSGQPTRTCQSIFNPPVR